MYLLLHMRVFFYSTPLTYLLYVKYEFDDINVFADSSFTTFSWLRPNTSQYQFTVKRQAVPLLPRKKKKRNTREMKRELVNALHKIKGP